MSTKSANSSPKSQSLPAQLRDGRGGEPANFSLLDVLDAITEGIVVIGLTSPAHPLIYASAGMTRLTGFASDALLGGGLETLAGPATSQLGQQHLQQALDKGVPATVELLHYRKDGTPFWDSVSLSPMVTGEASTPSYCVALLRDVSALKKVEQQSRQAHRMEAVGVLVGGIAHDFNNLLTAVMIYCGLMQTAMGPQNLLQRHVREINSVAERGATLVSQLLALSRQQVLEPRVVSINDLVVGMEDILQRMLGEDIRVVTQCAPDLGRVRVDPSRIHQVILNLAVNARDAMPSGGELLLETSNFDIDTEAGRESTGLRPGRYVSLEVTDNGEGMDEAAAARVFEPFFTTKEPGKGTGLGLASVYGIVKQSGGHISVNSSPGAGTSFQVLLPLVDMDAVEAGAGFEPEGRAIPAAPAPDAVAPRGALLLVEDDAVLRQSLQQALSAAGMSVLPAAGPEEALQISESFAGPIDIVVTDLVMPGMNGGDLARRIALQRPQVSILCMSGYSDQQRTGRFAPDLDFIAKPFTAASLIRRIRETLDAAAATGLPA